MSAATMQRELVTPEGVDLRVQLATYGERAYALGIDLAIMIAALVGLTLVCVVFALAGASQKLTREAVVIIWLVGAFLLRNAYFIAFEMGPRAATPGKRIAGVRVTSRNGGRLTAEAIFTRNALRELELYLPIGLLGAQAQVGDVSAWMYLAGMAWSLLFLLFPLFNRDRLRAGDLAAGTWVVRQPKRKLMRDLAEADDLMGGFSSVAGRFAFSEAQARAYGVKELHVLEDVLRVREPATLREVARRIRTKIDWVATDDESDQAFLRAYYAALRARLEGRLLFGHRRADKYDKA